MSLIWNPFGIFMLSPIAPCEQPVLRPPRQNELPVLVELMMLVDDEPPGFPWKSRNVAKLVDFAEHRLAECSEAFCLKHALVCERSGQIAGMMLGYRLPSTGVAHGIDGICPTLKPDADLAGRSAASFYLNTLSLYPGECKQGLGPVLLAAAERKAREARCSSMLLEVGRDNIAAVRFYRRHGFGLWPCVFGAEAGNPFLVLEKRLASWTGLLIQPLGMAAPWKRRWSCQAARAIAKE
jgi:ribosomal protein S18 acetylase RimI-like enzyme